MSKELSGSWYPVDAAAEYLNLSIHTIRIYVCRGLLIPTRRIGTMLLFDRNELDRYQRDKRSRGNPNFATHKKRVKKAHG